jgi:hypothetical protein
MLFKVTTTASNTDGIAVRNVRCIGLLSCEGHRHPAITKRSCKTGKFRRTLDAAAHAVSSLGHGFDLLRPEP